MLKLTVVRMLFAKRTQAALYLGIVMLCAVFVGAIAVTRQLTPSLTLLLVVLLGLTIALIPTLSTRIKDLPVNDLRGDPSRSDNFLIRQHELKFNNGHGSTMDSLWLYTSIPELLPHQATEV